MRIRLAFISLFTIISYLAQAQAEPTPDFMRSTGKIYVVAAVCLVILLAILVYLVRLDNRIKKIENRQSS